jgi:hypothetical protein
LAGGAGMIDDYGMQLVIALQDKNKLLEEKVRQLERKPRVDNRERMLLQVLEDTLKEIELMNIIVHRYPYLTVDVPIPSQLSYSPGGIYPIPTPTCEYMTITLKELFVSIVARIQQTRVLE